jgi:hypothetical protein
MAAKYGGSTAPSTPIVPPQPASNTPKIGKKKAAAAKSSKKTKSIIAMDKSLNLTPSGKKSAAQFATEKAPANVKQKCVVAVYYLREFIGLDKIGVSAVYTVFKTLGWPIPSDLKNTLQQAGSEGWLDTSDADDIKVTSMGENVVEHSLPTAKSK